MPPPVPPVPVPDAPPEPTGGTEASEPVCVSMLALDEPPHDKAVGARTIEINSNVGDIRFMVTHSSRVLATAWLLPAKNGPWDTDRGTTGKAPLRHDGATPWPARVPQQTAPFRQPASRRTVCSLRDTN